MRDFIRSLLTHPSLGPMVAHHRIVPGGAARFGAPARPLPAVLRDALATQGIRELYSHQAEALDAARAGRNVLAVTPTASGKSLVFALPVLESVLEDPRARALFLYPTKALAQDQVAALRALAGATGALRPPRIEIYDGDTADSVRRRIRAEPPEVLVTNPDMLHLGLLAHHDDWAPFLRHLRWVVLDELHVYRGIFGANVHHVIRRLRRLCAALGASPRFIAASATVGNPAEFAATLVGEPFEVVNASGAPRAERHVAFVQPVTVSPYTAAVRVVAQAAGAGLRTIAFTKARRVTELLHAWLVRSAPELAPRVAAYRAGYLPEERREIEARLFRGDLVAVLSTSALELGIDVGGLDVCVLVGYPGSLISSWQRIGRVGRAGRAAAVVLVALPDALDQYVVAHPDLFFGEAFEKAVLDPWNPIVAGHHLVCAATEQPLDPRELADAGPSCGEVVRGLAAEGKLMLDAEGSRWVSLRRRPHRDRSVRGAGEPFAIVDDRSGRVVGSVDGMRAHHECHPGAIYLHGGQSFLVRTLDLDARRATVEPASVDYYTVVLGEKETEILERRGRRDLGGGTASVGRLRVTVRIRGYQKKRLFGGESLSEHPLTVPPLVFETIGFWIELPRSLPEAATARGLHFMGGIHAAEHAMIGLFPLLAISERGDVGGISYTLHPQVGGPAIFVYDAMPGGAGLAEQGYRDLESLVARTADLIAGCACEDGCPACIQSPRCGNGNKPLDKAGALFALRVVRGEERIEEGALAPPPDPPAPEAPPTSPKRRKHGITRASAPVASAAPAAPVVPEPADDGGAALRPRPSPGRVLVVDVETQRSAEEVGGWSHIARMGLALAVVYDATEDRYRTYFEPDVERLLLDLALADRVVGFNIRRFDFEVLSAYTDRDLSRIRSLDLMADLFDRLGFRPSLAHLAEVNLGESKSGDGLQSLQWWREGKAEMVEHYCRKDVELTRRLYDLGRERGYLLLRGRDARAVRVPVDW